MISTRIPPLCSYSDGVIAIAGRWCDQLDGVSCCLPCPIITWRWSTLAGCKSQIQVVPGIH